MLFSAVRIEKHSVINDSVILPNVDIGQDCRISKAIIDEGCIIPEGTVIGENPELDQQRFHVSDEGITLVTPEMLEESLFSHDRPEVRVA